MHQGCQYYSKICYSRSKPVTTGKAYKHIEHGRMLVTWDEKMQNSSLYNVVSKIFWTDAAFCTAVVVAQSTSRW
jgi:hypothetical protein